MERTQTATESLDIDILHEIGSRMAAAGSFRELLDRVVDVAVALVRSDSCFVYVREDDDLVLRASKNRHEDVVDRLRLRLGEGITGWVAQHSQPVAIARNAAQDPHFRFFNDLPEDLYEAFLSVPLLNRARVVGVINLQHRRPHAHSRREIQLISTMGVLVGAEVERVRLETENITLHEQLESRKAIERAKGILQRESGMTEEAAYLALQRQSRQRRISMKEVADAIILTSEIKRESINQ